MQVPTFTINSALVLVLLATIQSSQTGRAFPVLTTVTHAMRVATVCLVTKAPTSGLYRVSDACLSMVTSKVELVQVLSVWQAVSVAFNF